MQTFPRPYQHATQKEKYGYSSAAKSGPAKEGGIRRPKQCKLMAVEHQNSSDQPQKVE
jgi:hypothetical protein